MPFKNPHPLYSCWQSMKRRCDSPNNPQYKDYGGRGITVCDKWINNFHAFSSDMGERPKGMTLDRIDNNKGYSPENCKWSTRKEQQRNRRYSIFVTIEGKRYRAVVLAEKACVKTDTIVARANRGLSLEEVLSKDKLRNLDGLALGAAISAKKRKLATHCKRGHEFDEINTAWYKGVRSCKKCHSKRERERKNK